MKCNFDRNSQKEEEIYFIIHYKNTPYDCKTSFVLKILFQEKIKKIYKFYVDFYFLHLKLKTHMKTYSREMQFCKKFLEEVKKIFYYSLQRYTLRLENMFSFENFPSRRNFKRFK